MFVTVTGSYYMGFWSSAVLTSPEDGSEKRQRKSPVNSIMCAGGATWVVKHRQLDVMVDAVFTLFSLYQFTSRYLWGARMLEAAAQCLDEPTLFLYPRAMLILTCLGWFYIRLGCFDDAESVFLRASAVFPRLDLQADMPYAFDPSVGFGLLAFMRGDYAEAQRLLDQAILTSEPVRHLVNLESAYYVLAGLQFALGQYHNAQQYAQAGYGAAQALQSRWFMAYCLNELGKATAALGDCASAAKHYEASYALREEFDDAEGMAVALKALGELALQQHDYDRAEQFLADSLSLYQGINDKGGRATVLHGLGRTAIARNAIGMAAGYLRQAMDTASDIRFVSLELNIMTSAAELLLTQGDLETADWLNFVYVDQGTEPRLRERVVQLQSQFDIDNGSASRIQAESSRSLNTIVSEVQTRLALFSEVLHRDLENKHHPTSVTESFTEQEGKILRLLAQELTNAEIAQELTVVVGTVKTHNHHIYAKLGVRNRTQAILRAREMHPSEQMRSKRPSVFLGITSYQS